MQRFILIVSFSGFLISGCNLFEADQNNEGEWIEPYLWEISFPTISGDFIHVDEFNRLFVTAPYDWAISTDNGKTFQYYRKPDSVRFELIKKRNNFFYAIGDYEVTELIFGTPTRVHSNGLFKSSDGNNWELILGPFRMNDFIFADGYLHVAKYNGVSSIDLSTGEEHLNEFLSTNSLDFINVLASNSKGDVFAGCHDGIYKTSDHGENWTRVSYPDVPKHHDDVRALYIDEQDRIFAIAGRRLLKSLDDGLSWSVQELYSNYYDRQNDWSTFYPTDINFSHRGFVYSSTYNGIYIAHIDSADKFYFAGPEGYDDERKFNYRNIKSFNDGSVILQYEDAYFYGEINPKSNFWEERNWN